MKGWAAPRKLELPYDPVSPLLGLYTKALKAENQTDTCTPMFTAAYSQQAKGRNNLNAHQ